MMTSIRDLWPVGILGDSSADELADMEIFQWPVIGSSKFPLQAEKRNSLFTLYQDWSLSTPDCQSDDDWLDLVMAQCLVDSSNLAKKDLQDNFAKEDLLTNSVKEDVLEVTNLVMKLSTKILTQILRFLYNFKTF